MRLTFFLCKKLQLIHAPIQYLLMFWVTCSELATLSLKTYNGIMISKVETLNQHFQSVLVLQIMMMMFFIPPISS